VKSRTRAGARAKPRLKPELKLELKLELKPHRSADLLGLIAQGFICNCKPVYRYEIHMTCVITTAVSILERGGRRRRR
jgi:hypothetical protein